MLTYMHYLVLRDLRKASETEQKAIKTEHKRVKTERKKKNKK